MNILVVSNLGDKLIEADQHKTILARSEFYTFMIITYFLYFMRAREWPACYDMNIYPLALNRPQAFDPLLNPNLHQNLRPVASVIEMHLKKCDLQESFIDGNDS